MSENGVSPGLWPVHGDGVLARQGDLVLLIHPAGGPFTDRLLELLASAARAGQDGLRFTELVVAEFEADAAAAAAGSDRPGPAVVAFGPASGGTAVAVYGTGWAEVTTAYGPQQLTAGEPYGRLRCVLPSTLSTLSAGVQPVTPGSETDPYLRLADGVVRAVALVYAPEKVSTGAAASGRPVEPDRGAAAGPAPIGTLVAGPAVADAAREEQQQPAPGPALAPEPLPGDQIRPAEPAAAAPGGPEAAPPVPEPDAPGSPPQVGDPADGDAARPDFVSMSLAPAELGGYVSSRGPLPPGAEPPDAEDLGLTEMPAEMVEGVYCPNGHFNDPEARFCAVCDIELEEPGEVRPQGRRPPLGVIILGDGSVCQLDADYVIGREPTLDSAVAEGRARPLRLIDASGVVSRIHARVELEGWHVFLTDLKSANGTQVLQPGDRSPISLEPGARTRLLAGAQIRLGGEYRLQYDAYDSNRHRLKP
jgi:hypothetical protein